MRVVDENFYIILALQNFRRGPPLLPAKPDEPDVITIYSASGCNKPTTQQCAF